MIYSYLCTNKFYRMKTFEELGVSEEILKAIKELGYEHPMPVQEEVIPYLLGDNDNDVVALAQTGTGKTAAFGIPLLQGIDISRKEPQALILCPTRELCLQIANDLRDYSKYMEDMQVLPVYGGTSIENQIRNFKKGVHIIVATPGRLIDLLERKATKLDTISKVVMDEADEMLDMGFTDSINAILERVPEGRNTLMFSATMSPEISKIAKNYLRNAKEIVIGYKNSGAENVHHIYYMVHSRHKYLALKRIADYYPDIYGIVFCRTRLETQEIADKLITDGYNADSLHGELSQAQRDLVMQKFRQRRLQILVATDVAARGLDVDDLTHVINYGFPDDIEVYTHRSGRTGRAGKTGTSIAIINMKEKGKVRMIEKVIGKKFEEGKLPTGQEICEKQLIKVIDEIEAVQVNEEEIASFLPGIYRKLDWLDKDDLIKRVVSLEFNRFLDYYSNAEEIETISGKGEQSGREKKKGKKGGSRRVAEEGFARLFLNMGRTDGMTPPRVMDMLNHNLHRRIDIGRIDIMQNFSFFEVPEEYADKVIKALGRLTVNKRKVTVEYSDAEGKDDDAPKKQGTDRRKSKARAKEDVRKHDDFRKFFSDDEFFDFGDDSVWAKKSKKKKKRK